MSQEKNDTAILTEMLAMADRLIARDDALMAGQYTHLRSRIAALIEVRSFADMESAE